MISTYVFIKHHKDLGEAVAQKVLVRLRNHTQQSPNLFIKPFNNLTYGTPFLRMRQASPANFIHRYLQIYPKLAKLLTMMDAIILKPLVFSFTISLSSSFFLPK
jgi:hypothetical protein